MALPLCAALGAACVVLATAGSASATTAPIVTVAGNGQLSPFPAPESGGSFTPATSVPIASAAGIATLPDSFGGTFVFADPADNRILQVTDNGQISVLAGTGVAGDLQTSNPPDSRLRVPKGVAMDVVGYVIADTNNYCILKISGAGLGSPSLSIDAGDCDDAVATVGSPGTPPTAGSPADARDVETWPGAGDTEPSYYTASSLYVFAVSGTGGTRNIAIAAGSNSTFTPPADNSSPTSGWIGFPEDVSVGSSETTYFIASSDAFRGLNRIFKVTAGKIFTVAGLGTGPLGDGAAATAATLSNPTGVLALADGGFLVYDAGHARIRRVSGGGGTPTISTIAGNGIAGGSPDGTPADAASLRAYGRLALAPSGLLFTQMANGVGGLVRKIPATAIVSGPSGAVSSASASFGLASWDDHATYACRIDLGSFGACGSYPNLTDGSHTFQARATTNGTMLDTAGATRTWTVDTTPPADFALTSPDEGATVAPQPSFTWQAATDATTSIARYELWIDGAKAADTTSCCSADAPAKLADGTHSWQVKAFDQAGNERAGASRSFVVNTPPVAVLTIGPARALVGRAVTFDGAGSSDDNGTVAHYEWDLDGDGVFETDTGSVPRTTRSYDKPQTLTISLRVTDNDGLTGKTSGQLVVTTSPPVGKQLGVSINDGAQYTNDPNVTVFSVWPSFASDMLVSNDGGFKLAQSLPVTEQTAWKLDSSGPERLPKTIYVRFLAGTQISETFQDDIILDQIPPKVLGATLAGASSVASAAKVKKVTLKIKATDSNSGVGAMQVTTNKRKPGKVLKYKKAVKVKPAKRLYVRVRDRAGNFSRWRKTIRR